jgi:hypothetical protein
MKKLRGSWSNMETLILGLAAVVSQQAFIGWIVLFLVVAYLCAKIGDLFYPPKKPAPPFRPPSIPPPPDSSGQSLNMRVPREQLDRCIEEANRLAEEGSPGWAYRAALVLFEPQLAALREQFDYRLSVPKNRQATTTLSELSQYYDYRNTRRNDMERTLARMSEQFSTGLTTACKSGDLEQILNAVNAIIRNCRWIHAWGIDHQRYQSECATKEEQSRGLRQAEHIFRQVETLVADWKRKMEGSQHPVSFLFRAEFYFPKDEEVDRPVIAVIGTPHL